MTRIYLDYAATAPLRAVARDAMLPWLGVATNPNSLHHEGRQARQALDSAREVFATLLGVRPREIVFTASGSESITLALIGAMRASGSSGRIITSPIEHRAVLAAAAEMSRCGWEHVLLPVNSDGAVDMQQLQAVLADADDGLPQILSLMLVNNELGTVNDVRAAAQCAHTYGALVHCDAIGAGALVPFAPLDIAIDFLSLAAHKFGGPLGVGVLVARARTAIVPTVFGGGQEFGKRAGTENLAAIIGAAAAIKEADALRTHDVVVVQAMRDAFEAYVCEALPDTRVHAQGVPRAPGITHIAIPALENDILPAALDLSGIAASAGSACASGALKRSHVLDAIGYRTGAAIRFSWGTGVTQAQTLDAADRFVDVVRRALTG